MKKLIEVLFVVCAVYAACFYYISCDTSEPLQPSSFAALNLDVHYYQVYAPVKKTASVFAKVNRAEIVFYHIDQSLDQTIDRYDASERAVVDSTRSDFWNFDSYWLEYDNELLSDVTQNRFELIKRDELSVANGRVSGRFTLSPGLKSLRLACMRGDTVIYTGIPEGIEETPFFELEAGQSKTVSVLLTPVQNEVSTPFLQSPPDRSLLSNTTPQFNWYDVTGARLYQIQIDNNPDFSSPEIQNRISSVTFEISEELDTGTYFWRVRSRDSLLRWGDWSDVWSFTLSL